MPMGGGQPPRCVCSVPPVSTRGTAATASAGRERQRANAIQRAARPRTSQPGAAPEAARKGTMTNSSAGRFDVVTRPPVVLDRPDSAWIRRRIAMATPTVATPTTMAVSIMACGSGLCIGRPSSDGHRAVRAEAERDEQQDDGRLEQVQPDDRLEQFRCDIIRYTPIMPAARTAGTARAPAGYSIITVLAPEPGRTARRRSRASRPPRRASRRPR
jgi:hypothetical protein